MVSSKLIVLSCLLALACATPAPAPTSHKNEGSAKKGPPQVGFGNVVGGVGTILNSVITEVSELYGGAVDCCLTVVRNFVGGVGTIAVGLGQVVSHGLVDLGPGLTPRAGDAPTLFTNIGRLEIPDDIDDVFNLLINLGIAVGGVINAILPGVGDAVGTLVVGLLKVLICVVKSPAILGAVFGDRSPGAGGIPVVCTPNFGPSWGIPGYDGSYNDPQTVIKFYKLGQLEPQIKAEVNKVTSGGGVPALQGNARFIVQWLLQITQLTKKRDLNEADFVTLIVNLVTITGGVGNSVKPGLGNDLISDLLTKLTAVLDEKALDGADLESYVSGSIQKISVCKQDKLYGAVNLSKSS